MKPNATYLSLLLACAFLFGAAFSCQQSNSHRADDRRPDQDGQRAAENGSENSAALPGLVSTNWSEVSLAGKGETEHQYGTYPNLQFCRDGSWGIHHYGGADLYEEQGGSYEMSGNHVVMKNDDGTRFGDFHLVSRTGDELYLETDDGWTMHLKYLGKVNC